METFGFTLNYQVYGMQKVLTNILTKGQVSTYSLVVSVPVMQTNRVQITWMFYSDFMDQKAKI